MTPERRKAVQLALIDRLRLHTMADAKRDMLWAVADEWYLSAAKVFGENESEYRRIVKTLVNFGRVF